MIENIEKSLKYIDIYGQNIQLNFKGQNPYKTVFGGLLSLAFFTFICVGSWFFGRDLINKENPQVISSDRPVDDPKRISITPDNLIIVLGLANNSSIPFIDPTIFKVRAVQEITVNSTDTRTGESIKKLVEVEKSIKMCTREDIGISSVEKYFSQVKLSNYYCFDGRKEDIYMEGDFSSEQFSQIYAYFEKCKNSTQSTVVCKPQEVIDETLRFTKLQIYMSDHTVEPSNFQQPFKDRGISLYTITSSYFPQEIGLFFANYYIETDVGLIFKTVETKQSFVFVQQTVNPFFSDSNVLGRVLFRLQKQKEMLMQRQYLKFADFLAQIGGLLKMLIVFGSIISSPIAKLYLYKSAVDEIFQFSSSHNVKLVAKNTIKISETQSKNSQPSPLKKPSTKKGQKQPGNSKNPIQSLSFKLQSLKNNMSLNQSELAGMNQSQSPDQISSNQNGFQFQKQDNYNVSNTQKNSKNQSECNVKDQQQFSISKVIENAKDYFQKTHQVVKYKFTHYFIHAFFPRAKNVIHKFKLVNEGVSKIQDHLDVMYILNKLLEVDKIKYLLLNEDQLKLFEYIPKPVISDDILDIHSDRIEQGYAQNNNKQVKEQETKENKIQSQQTNINFQKFNSINKQAPKCLSGYLNSQINIQDNIIESNNNMKEIQRRKSTAAAVSLQKNLYSEFGKKQTEQQTIQSAYEGLLNILQQKKFSKIDEKLVQLIDPNLVAQIQREQELIDQIQDQFLQLPLNQIISNQLSRNNDNFDRLDLKKSNLPSNYLEVIKDSSFNQMSSQQSYLINMKEILYEGFQEQYGTSKALDINQENPFKNIKANKKQIEEDSEKAQEQLNSSQETCQISIAQQFVENQNSDVQQVYKSPMMKQIQSKQLLQSQKNK